MFIEHISGASVLAAEMRCSTVMVTAPPVVMFTTASVACLMRGRNCMKTDASDDGRPSFGSRACRCRMAAPAAAASMAWVAIWSGVIGSASDMVGVWIEPVIAQLMTIFAMVRFSLSPFSAGAAKFLYRRRCLGNAVSVSVDMGGRRSGFFLKSHGQPCDLRKDSCSAAISHLCERGHAECVDNVINDLAGMRRNRDHDRPFVRGRLFQRRELAVEQRRRHEMVVAGGNAPRDQFAVALEENQPHVAPLADQNIAIGALERRAGDDAVVAGAARFVDPGGDGAQPRPAIFVGQRLAVVHFLDV